MRNARKLPDQLRSNIRKRGVRAVSHETGLSPATVSRALTSGKASESTLVKLERIKDRLRKSDEFTAVPVVAQRRRQPVTEWSVERIRSARNAQMRGDFQESVRLAEAMKTDDAAFVAFHARIAPGASIATKLIPGPGARGEATARRAMASCIISRATLASVHGTLADHGIAIGYIKREVNEEGTREDFELTEWPLEHVKYNESTEVLETRTETGPMVPIVHGDGRWVVFRKFAVKPWQKEAAVLPGALAMAAHTQAIGDWSGAARSHGRPRVFGEMPAGVAMAGESGALTSEADAFLTMMAEVIEGEDSAGLRPAGAKTDLLANNSSAYQVFTELVSSREKAFARIYLGTDAILGSVGGAPGVDIAQLFGVATTKVQGDFTALQEGLRTGLYEPWTAVNEGDSRNTPSLVYLMPDPDAEQKVQQDNERLTMFLAAIDQLKQNGFIVDQTTVNALAAVYRVTAPLLKPVPVVAPAPTEPGAA